MGGGSQGSGPGGGQARQKPGGWDEGMIYKEDYLAGAGAGAGAVANFCNLCGFLLEMRVLCGYFDPNTRICRSTRIYAGMLGTLILGGI